MVESLNPQEVSPVASAPWEQMTKTNTGVTPSPLTVCVLLAVEVSRVNVVRVNPAVLVPQLKALLD